MESDIADLIEEVNSHAGTEILMTASYLHAQFEYIHPFSDGNGRVGRTLLNYYLMINGHPPLIVYEEDKRLYNECLQEYDEKEEIQPLYNFFVYATEKTWKKALDMSNKSKTNRKKLYEISCEDYNDKSNERHNNYFCYILTYNSIKK